MNKAQQSTPLPKFRLRFSKQGRGIYISHLDLMRTLQRAFHRGSIPLKYSQGFNPHAQIAIALPLSVGTSSTCELMDFSLREQMSPDEIIRRLKESLPEGIDALEVYEAQRKFKELKWLEAEVRFEYDSGDLSEKAAALRDFFSRETIVISKKTKSGMKEEDIVPSIRTLNICAGKDAVEITAVLSAQEPTLNPERLVSALEQLAPELLPDHAVFHRLGVYDSLMQPFR